MLFQPPGSALRFTALRRVEALGTLTKLMDPVTDHADSTDESEQTWIEQTCLVFI